MKNCLLLTKNCLLRSVAVPAGISLLTIIFSCSPGKRDESGEPDFASEAFIREKIAGQMVILEKNVRERLDEQPEMPGPGKPFLPRNLNEEGEIRLVTAADWCSGFYPGCLWLMVEHTGNEHWEPLARDYTAKLESQQWNTSDHDIGFRMMCSFGNGYRLTGDSTYRDILIRSARSLITRYNDTVGCIRSWDWNEEVWEYPVIIDNMMNLELLFFATRETGDSVYHRIADRHAHTTLVNHFREDNSAYHVLDYDPETGEVLARTTHQGYSDESAWARGQAWGLYGYTMTYRFTKDPRYLEQAEKIALFTLQHPNLPKDLIPYWDYDAPGIPDEPRDASAAAITASALLELARYSSSGERYQDAAMRILESLSSPEYLSVDGENRGFLLDHSTGHRTAGSEVDCPIIYADYYFLEALKRVNRNPTRKMALVPKTMVR
ncbi:MAG: glycoside hydrolase family 88 protein [Bacteroidales bacterium]